MQLSLARNFAKGIDLGKRAWIPLAEASTVPAEDTHNQLGEAPGPIASSSECVIIVHASTCCAVLVPLAVLPPGPNS
jgi:hypothetical protein